jgi:hypothetical protein
MEEQLFNYLATALVPFFFCFGSMILYALFYYGSFTKIKNGVFGAMIILVIGLGMVSLSGLAMYTAYIEGTLGAQAKDLFTIIVFIGIFALIVYFVFSCVSALAKFVQKPKIS